MSMFDSFNMFQPILSNQNQAPPVRYAAMPLTSRQPQAAAWRRDAVSLISGPLGGGRVRQWWLMGSQ